MRKPIFTLMLVGLIVIFCFGGSILWAGVQDQEIPAYLQKRVLAVCADAAQRGLMAPVGRVDRPTLIALAQAPCPRVRNAAVYTLGDIRCSQAVGPLIGLLAGPDLDLRRAAAHALGKIGDPEAVGPLYAVAMDQDQPSPVRCTALKALGRIGGDHAVQGLRMAARNCRGRVQMVALVSLHKNPILLPPTGSN